MTEGVTCYERDEDLCEDQMCLRTGCRLRNQRLSGDVAQPTRAPMPVKHYTGMPGSSINGEVIYDWLMDDGSVEAMTASDVVKRRASQPSSAATVDNQSLAQAMYAEGYADAKAELAAPERLSAGNVDLIAALDRVIGHDPKGLTYDTLEQLLSSAANAARDLRAALTDIEPQTSSKTEADHG